MKVALKAILGLAAVVTSPSAAFALLGICGVAIFVAYMIPADYAEGVL